MDAANGHIAFSEFLQNTSLKQQESAEGEASRRYFLSIHRSS